MQTETSNGHIKVILDGPLTPDKLRKYPDLVGISDGEAAKIIADLAVLSRFLYEFAATQKI